MVNELSRESGQLRRLAAAFLAVCLVGLAPSAQQSQNAASEALNAYLATHGAPTVQLIVQTSGDAGPVMSSVRASGGSVSGQYATIDGFAATVSRAEADRLNHDPRVKTLTLNAPIQWNGAVDYSHLLNRYNELSRVVSQGWNGKNLDGTGVQVAVIDSGVWPHDDLVQNSSEVPANSGNRLDLLFTNPLATDALDHVGHGTHVAGIVAGNGYDSGGQYIGIAPNALVVSVKVADNLGNANEGDVISGLDWVYQANQHGMHIRVINLSLQSTVQQSYRQSPLDAMVEKLWFSGVTVVVSAGNGNGPVFFPPANDPFVITVGSIDDHYQNNLSQTEIAPWSLTGTTQDGFAKPDIVADGSHVVSLLAPASSLSVQHPSNIVGTNYFKMGGTSMAAPMVAGMAALMLQANPSLSPDRLKSMLAKGSTSFSTINFTKGLGRKGGFLDSDAIGKLVPADANGGVPTSNSFDPLSNSHPGRRHRLGGCAVGQRLVERHQLERDLLERHQLERHLLELQPVDRDALPDERLLGPDQLGQHPVGRDLLERHQLERHLLERDPVGGNQLERDILERHLLERHLLERDQLEQHHLRGHLLERDVVERHFLERDQLEHGDLGPGLLRVTLTARAYIGVVFALGVDAVLLSAGLAPLPTLLPLLVVCAAAAIGEAVKLAVSDDSPVAISLTFSLSLAALIAVGPFAASLAAVVGAASAWIIHRPRPQVRKTLFNIGLFGLSTSAAGLAYTAVGGALGRQETSLRDIAACAAAFAAYIATNWPLLLAVIRLTSGRAVRAIWREDLRWTPTQITISAAIGFSIGAAYNFFGLAGVAVYLLPLLGLREAMRQYTERVRAQMAELRLSHFEADSANQQLLVANQELDATNAGLLKTLASVIDARDIYLYGHSVQASKYAGEVARKLGLPPTG